MSVQSDLEMLYILAAEDYATINNISIKDTHKLFQNHYVFEKMIIQYERLHQLPLEDTFDFVQEVIASRAKDIVLFHGTIANFDTIQLNQSKNARDFGAGFYTTVLESQAKSWGNRLCRKHHSNKFYVMKFLFVDNDSLKIKRFSFLNEEWLEFVKENRSKGGVQHDYDVVIGPVADDNTMKTIQMYAIGDYTTQEAMNRLRYSQSSNQISFHSEKALRYLEFIGREKHEANIHV